MNRFLSASAFAVATAAQAGAQSHEHCPMASEPSHRADVDHRHDDATGVPHDAAEHHFRLARDGGSIRLEVKKGSPVEGRDVIRQHLRSIARSFASGDFSVPMLIHDQVPPGVEVMKARRTAIRYAYAPTDRGGVVRIASKEPRAIDAIHDFLRFQIRDHGTGDPTE